MKRAGVISTAILFLLLGTAAPAYAQHEQQGNEQGKSQKGKEQGQSQQGQQHQQAKPAPQQRQQPAQQRTRPTQRGCWWRSRR